MVKFKRLPCQWESPELVASQLIKEWGEAGFIWLDGDGSELGRWVTMAINPIDQFCSRKLGSSTKETNPFEILRELPPGHWTGWLSYEAASWIEPKNPWQSCSMAKLWIASHDPVLKFDLKKKQLWLEGQNEKNLSIMENFLKNIFHQTTLKSQKEKTNQIKAAQSIPLESWKWKLTNQEYSRKVDEIKNWIANGDIFQANLTTSCKAILPKAMTPLDVYSKLRKCSPAPFAGVIVGDKMTKGEAIISTSPERFLKALPNGEVETRPIKGTRPRDIDPQKDADWAAELICSPKDRAENIMIVDLLRNDFSRVCKPGSVNVPQLLSLESYPKVHHLTSVVKGTLNTNKTWVDLIEACWPGGSVTGAPKLRACKRLYELEPTARGPYCGSIINLNWDGILDSNILIRSLMIKESIITAHAGCGIVADSDSKNEAEEMNWKLMPLLHALT
tara:strand:+ start:4316 stop:5656 length:1341 start_codon:yes stop_codon:yes gene_type:complete